MVVLMVKVPNSGIDLSIILYMCKKQIEFVSLQDLG